MLVKNWHGFQNYELFGHMNVIDNILLGPLKVQKRHRDEAEQVADELLKRVGLLSENSIIHDNFLVDKTAYCHCSFTGHATSSDFT